MRRRVGVGLYGSNGHQLSHREILSAGGFLAAACACGQNTMEKAAHRCETLEELLAYPAVEVVSICAPVRSQQWNAVQAALLRGKHVYAEKPCVMDTVHWENLMALAESRGLIFCEMAGTFLDPVYRRAGEVVKGGMIGQTVQVFAQKSYPYADWRPQDENVDGGLILQNAVYGLRFVEHIAGERAASVQAWQTALGNPLQGGLKMAAALNVTLRSGGLATIIANYLNPPSTGCWGNEELRIFGTKGYLRTNQHEQCVELYTRDGRQRLPGLEGPGLFEILLRSIGEGREFPFSPRELARPTRLAIWAWEHANIWKGE